MLPHARSHTIAFAHNPVNLAEDNTEQITLEALLASRDIPRNTEDFFLNEMVECGHVAVTCVHADGSVSAEATVIRRCRKLRGVLIHLHPLEDIPAVEIECIAYTLRGRTRTVVLSEVFLYHPDDENEGHHMVLLPYMQAEHTPRVPLTPLIFQQFRNEMQVGLHLKFAFIHSGPTSIEWVSMRRLTRTGARFRLQNSDDHEWRPDMVGYEMETDYGRVVLCSAVWINDDVAVLAPLGTVYFPDLPFYDT